MKLPFGKYKGQEISNTPTDYLRWVITLGYPSNSELKKEIEDELISRDKPTTGKTTKYALYVFGEKLAELFQHIPDNFPFGQGVEIKVEPGYILIVRKK